MTYVIITLSKNWGSPETHPQKSCHVSTQKTTGKTRRICVALGHRLRSWSRNSCFKSLHQWCWSRKNSTPWRHRFLTFFVHRAFFSNMFTVYSIWQYMYVTICYCMYMYFQCKRPHREPTCNWNWVNMFTKDVLYWLSKHCKDWPPHRPCSACSMGNSYIYMYYIKNCPFSICIYIYTYVYIYSQCQITGGCAR